MRFRTVVACLMAALSAATANADTLAVQQCIALAQERIAALSHGTTADQITAGAGGWLNVDVVKRCADEPMFFSRIPIARGRPPMDEMRCRPDMLGGMDCSRY